MARCHITVKRQRQQKPKAKKHKNKTVGGGGGGIDRLCLCVDGRLPASGRVPHASQPNKSIPGLLGTVIAQELCGSRGGLLGSPSLTVLIIMMVSVDVLWH